MGWRLRLLGALLLVFVTGGCGYAVATLAPSSSATPSVDLAASPTPVVATSEGPPTAAVSPSGSPPEVEATPSPIAGACQSDVDMGVVPTWARAGFSEPEPAMPHVLSQAGDVVAILFGFPLASPPREGINNKILWVHRDGPTSPVEVSAQLMNGSERVGEPVQRRLDDGFAPSIVDLPGAGCWRLTLSYGDETDSIDLEYIQTPAG